MLKAPGGVPGAIYCNRTATGRFRPLALLAERFVHRGRCAAVYAGQNVRIGVERQRDAGVSEKLLDVLGVDVAGEEQGAQVCRRS